MEQIRRQQQTGSVTLYQRNIILDLIMLKKLGMKSYDTALRRSFTRSYSSFRQFSVIYHYLNSVTLNHLRECIKIFCSVIASARTSRQLSCPKFNRSCLKLAPLRTKGWSSRRVSITRSCWFVGESCNTRITVSWFVILTSCYSFTPTMPHTINSYCIFNFKTCTFYLPI